MNLRKQTATPLNGVKCSLKGHKLTILGLLFTGFFAPFHGYELENQTIQSQLDIVFGHVERIELQRELQFMEQIETAAKKAEP